MRTISICGSTGSIGTSTLAIVSHLKKEFSVFALTSQGNQLDLLEEQVRTYQPKIVAIHDAEKAAQFKKRMLPVRVVQGDEGMAEAVTHPSIDFVMMAIVGMAALKPTLAAIEQGKRIGFASKEVLVAAGQMVIERAAHFGATLIPVDSEHSALFQCLQNHPSSEVGRLILTASGGPFYHYSDNDLQKVDLTAALKHPRWKMGPKVTIDSSTLMNKGLEVIEAYFLFGIELEKISVVIHPQSIIHSMVEFIDGSIISQMSEPLMFYPIQYAMTYPKRMKGKEKPFDFVKNNKLEFYPADFNKFRALALAYDVLREGGSMPCYMNAANEMLVGRFIQGEITWLEIIQKLDRLLLQHQKTAVGHIDDLFAIDQCARREARSI